MPTSTKNHRFLHALVFLAAVLVLTLSAGGRSASAHNTQESSAPAEGDVLTSPPIEWQITFASPVPLDSATGELVLSDARRIDLAAPVHGDTDRMILFPLPADLSGEVTARWRLVGVDGHVISGRVSFTITTGGTSTNQLVAPQVDNDVAFAQGIPQSVRYSLRLLDYLFILAIGGVMFIDLNIARGTSLLPLGRRIVTLGSAGLVAIPILQGLVYTADLRDTSVFSAPFGIVEALGTTPGAMHFTRGAVAGIIAFLLNRMVRPAGSSDAPKDEVLHILLASSGVMYLLTLGYVGHSRSQRLPWIGIPVDIAHVAAATVWLGGLAVLIVVVIPSVPTDQGIKALLRFGPAARVAVLTLAGTGLVQSLRLHDGLSSLFGSSHGRLLLLKVALVLGMLRFAAINQGVLRRYSQSMQTRPTEIRRQLTRATTIEAVLGLLVIVVTAALVSASFDGST